MLAGALNTLISRSEHAPSPPLYYLHIIALIAITLFGCVHPWLYVTSHDMMLLCVITCIHVAGVYINVRSVRAMQQLRDVHTTGKKQK